MRVGEKEIEKEREREREMEFRRWQRRHVLKY